MSAIQVKNVPEDLHAALRERAAAEGKTIGEVILESLRRDLRRQTMREWLDQLREDGPRPGSAADSRADGRDHARGRRRTVGTRLNGVLDASAFVELLVGRIDPSRRFGLFDGDFSRPRPLR